MLIAWPFFTVMYTVAVDGGVSFHEPHTWSIMSTLFPDPYISKLLEHLAYLERERKEAMREYADRVQQLKVEEQERKEPAAQTSSRLAEEVREDLVKKGSIEESPGEHEACCCARFERSIRAIEGKLDLLIASRGNPGNGPGFRLT